MAYRTLAVGKKNKTEAIREYEPCKRTIVSACWDEEGKFLVQFPYVIFFHQDHTLFVAFAKRPVKSLRSMVYAPTIGNVYPDYHVCGAETTSLKDSIRDFWQSEFTDDGELGNDALCDTFGSYKNWEKISKKGKTTVTKKIRFGKMTLKNFLRATFDEEDYDYWYEDDNVDKDLKNLLDSLQFTFDSKYSEPITIEQFAKALQTKKKKISAELEKKRRAKMRHG